MTNQAGCVRSIRDVKEARYPAPGNSIGMNPAPAIRVFCFGSNWSRDALVAGSCRLRDEGVASP
jgi:hypothetical protein